MTAIAKKRIQSRIARHERVRKSVVGTAECPRLAVRRSLSHMIAQIFDDENNKSVAQVTTASKEFQGKFGEMTKTEQAKQLGLQIAELAKSKGIESVVFEILVRYTLEREAQVSEFEDKVVHINRCAKTVKGGRRMSFSALVVVGNKNGKVGVGLGKAKEVSEAIRKGTEAAQRNIVEVQLLDGTIPHDIEVKSGSTRILLMPAAPGTGVIAGAAARAVLELAGVRNILTKIHGSSNPSTVVSACLEGLLSQKNKQDCAKLRGFEA